MEQKKSLLAKIKEANTPPTPNHSIWARVLICIAIVTVNLACLNVQEIGTTAAATATLLSLVGIVFSYFTRNKPWQRIKILIAISVLAVFFIFITEILQNIQTAQLSSIEPPLASLFLWIQALHSLDTPARRDLLFSVAASTALLIISAAQSLSTSFFVYVVIWFVTSAVAMELLQHNSTSEPVREREQELDGLTAGKQLFTGSSGKIFSGKSRPVPGNDFYGLAAAKTAPPRLERGTKQKTFTPKHPGNLLADKLSYLLISLALGIVIIIFLPPASTAPSIKLPSSLTTKIGLGNSGSLYGGTTGSEPSSPGKTSAPIRIGGYNGFTNSLDTAIRGALSNTVIMHVRATQPGYFLSMTYSKWTGTTWLNKNSSLQPTLLKGPSPFYINSGTLSGKAILAPSVPVQASDIQTFYIEEPMANVILGASQPTTVWFPSSKLYLDTTDSSIRTGIAITSGTIYTVISADTEEGASVLQADNYSVKEMPLSIQEALQTYLQLPKSYKRVKALTLAITSKKRGVYNKVAALESWMSSHVRYSLNIPPLLPGQDSVDQFLFHARIGYCEQISTALAVMLRSIGIPTREAVGYVPGNFNPLTDLFDVRESDAHAWVQVWFPRYGWQNFDPTANVALATPSPGAIIAKYILNILKIIFWPVGLIMAIIAMAAESILILLRKRRIPPVKKFISALDLLGIRIAMPRNSCEPIAPYYNRIKMQIANNLYRQNMHGKFLNDPEHILAKNSDIKNVVDIVNRSLYSEYVIKAEDIRSIRHTIKKIKRVKRKLRISFRSSK